MPWQRYVADVAGEMTPDGRMAYSTVLVSVPRQAGKTTLVGPEALYPTFLPGGRSWYTAQTRNDARDAFLDVVQAAMRSQFRRALKTRETNGSEALTVKPTAGQFRLFAPLPSALHGRQSDRVFLDEIWAHTMERGRELMQAIKPTMATRAAPQLWLLSTAGTEESEWLAWWIEQALTGANPKLAFFDWGVPRGTDADDLDAIAAAHPALGYTISRAALEEARGDMEPGEFLRAYGNLSTLVGERLITAAQWSAVQSGHLIPRQAAVTLAYDAAPNRQSAAIVACAAGPDGRPLVEIIEQRDGVHWLGDRVAELHRKWSPAAIWADSKGPATSATDALVSAGIPVRTTTTAEYATACGSFYDLLTEGQLQVVPHPDLDRAAAAVGRRDLSDAWAWSRTAPVPISGIIAATLALWGHTRPAEASPYVL